MASGPTVAPAELNAVADMPAPSLLSLFRTFFKVGSTAFGMATLQSVRAVTVKLGWMSRAEIDEGLGLVQLYPGAMMVDLVTYIGYRKRRVPGALVSAAGFIAPSLVLTLALAWLYSAYGATPGVASMVVGLDAIVVGIVASVAADLGAQHFRGPTRASAALAAFGLSVAGANPLLIVVVGLLVGVIALRPGSPSSAAGPPGEVSFS